MDNSEVNKGRALINIEAETEDALLRAYERVKKDVEQKRLDGVPIRVYLMNSLTVHLHSRLAQGFAGEKLNRFISAVRKVVRVRQSNTLSVTERKLDKSSFRTYVFESDDENILRTLEREIDSMYATESFTFLSASVSSETKRDQIASLFSSFGKRYLRQIESEWNDRSSNEQAEGGQHGRHASFLSIWYEKGSHNIMLIGSDQARAWAKQKINTYIEQCLNLTCERIRFKTKLTPDLKATVGTIVTEAGCAFDLILTERLLWVLASDEVIARLRRGLEELHLVRPATLLNQMSTEAKADISVQCSGCFDNIKISDAPGSTEGGAFRLQPGPLSCGHCLCDECCFMQMFHSKQFKCMYPHKDQKSYPFPISTIRSVVTDPSAWSSVLEDAVIQYRIEHKEEFKICGLKGCNQIYRFNPSAPVRTCDACGEVYCVACTEACGKKILPHPNRTCGEVRAMHDAGLNALIEQIGLQVIALRTPCCGALYLDHTACCCVTCYRCSREFCALCMAYSAGPNATHTHIRTCTNNPGSGYFVDPEELFRIHASLRTKRLRELLTSTPLTKEQRQALVEVLEGELKKKGVDLTTLLATMG